MLEILNQDSPYGAKLVSLSSFAKGDLIWQFSDYKILSTPTRLTIQIGRDAHIEDLDKLVFINHSCRPNVIVDVKRLACYAAGEIQADDELAFFYPSTEWDMLNPFVCLCGAPECIRLVVGAKYLTLDVLSRYHLNDHIYSEAIACLESLSVPG